MSTGQGWRDENKEKINENKRRYNQKRKETDPLFKLKHDLRNLTYKALIGRGFNKNSKTEEMLGISFEEFKYYLESKFVPVNLYYVLI